MFGKSVVILDRRRIYRYCNADLSSFWGTYRRGGAWHCQARTESNCCCKQVLFSNEDAFPFAVVIQHSQTQFASQSTPLDATKGRFEVNAVSGVDRKNTRFDRPRHAQCSTDIPRPEGTRKTIQAVIRDRDRVIFRIEWKYANNRPKNFFSHNLHVRRGISKNSGLQISSSRQRSTGTITPTEQVSTFSFANVDVVMDAIAMTRGN